MSFVQPRENNPTLGSHFFKFKLFFCDHHIPLGPPLLYGACMFNPYPPPPLQGRIRKTVQKIKGKNKNNKNKLVRVKKKMHAQTALTTRAHTTIVILAKSLYRGILIFFRMPKRGRVHEDGKHGGGERRKKKQLNLARLCG